MRIEGKVLANTILHSLTLKGIPALAVIQVGDDPASTAYITQKKKAAETVGIKLIHSHHPRQVSKATLQAVVDLYNQDLQTHGVIIQRPLPPDLGDPIEIIRSVHPAKDVDGFLPGSRFDVPVALAVAEILKHVHAEIPNTPNPAGLLFPDQSGERARDDGFIGWLKTKNITVIGRGDTAGAPIFHYFRKLGCTVAQIHTQSKHPHTVMKNSDIIVSCVGKKQVVTPEYIKPGVILVSVGIWRDESGKLHGDYEEDDVKDIASFYTPTPGGVGPVNVACLMQNVVRAAKMILGNKLTK